MGGKCQCCGYDRCPAALDFHHPNAREKDFNISSTMSWEKIRPELDKCYLLCATCHRETHAGLHPRFLDDGVDAYEVLEESSEVNEDELEYQRAEEVLAERRAEARREERLLSRYDRP